MLTFLVAALATACGCGAGGAPGYRQGDIEGINTACDLAHGPPPGSVFHVSVDGTPEGDGSAARPWDISTALDDPEPVEPGDTILLHGGVYSGWFVGKLTGEAGAPVTIRSAPGDWATLDGAGAGGEPVLQIYRRHAIYRDMEITSSDPDRRSPDGRPSGIYVEGEGIALWNLVIHDVGTGIICSSASADYPELAPDLEVAGCILYNNGWDGDDRAHGHHLYLQNRDGTKRITDNLAFNAFGFGLHLYTDDENHFVEGYEIEGNAWWGNGCASTVHDKLYDGCLVGGRQPVRRLAMRHNMGWAPSPGERDVRLGWDVPGNEGATLESNTLVGTTILQES